MRGCEVEEVDTDESAARTIPLFHIALISCDNGPTRLRTSPSLGKQTVQLLQGPALSAALLSR